MLSIAEENYIKRLVYLSLENGAGDGVGTNELATGLQVKPSTANDMLKKLRQKELIDYEKYGKIHLTELGTKIGMEIIRKHRLWETFLYEKLEFTWDEVHEVAEQLEHIQSEKLVEKLDKFLGFPKFDPHGDPIPNQAGEMQLLAKKMLAAVNVGEQCKMVAVKDNSAVFLNYVVELGLGINNQIEVLSKQDFDDSMEIRINGKTNRVSKKFAQNIYVIAD
ncbi:MAG: metal-dependent transcriptional regulator [Crocinitomicaceae bacterium]|nr:MAG: metal-dependent transcriptional regulator [Crocinitomicaceae bacterium]